MTCRSKKSLKIMVSEKELKIIVGALDSACMEVFGAPLANYKNRSHKRKYADVRMMSVRILRENTCMTYVEIAELFGMHYTTIIYSYYRAGDLLLVDGAFGEKYEEYEKHFKNSL